MRHERKRTLFLIALGIGASALVLGAAVRGPLRVRTERQFKPGTLPHAAKELKAKGITKHKLGVAAVPFPVHLVGGLDQLLAQSDATVLATLLDQRYRISADLENVETIAKFRVEDFVSGTLMRARGQVSAQRMPAGAKALGPLKDDEILVFRGGGTVIVDGVLFHQSDYGYPPFQVGRQYILFLHEMEPRQKYDNHYGDRNVRLYSTSLGPDGAYWVEEDGPFTAKIEARGLTDPDLRKELQQRFLSQKGHFVDHLRRIGRKPQILWLEGQ